MDRKHRFDLTDVDPETSNLDLKILAPEKFKAIIRRPSP